MPRRIVTASRCIHVSNLDPASFAPFGEVVQNPSTHNGQPALKTVEANQGTATKWLDVTKMEDFYATCKRRKANAAMNMFVCRPRQLKAGRVFHVGILERHPYTPQTFIPTGLDKRDQQTAYLVIVAPTLPFEAWQELDIRMLETKRGQSDHQLQRELLGAMSEDRTRRAHAKGAGSSIERPGGPPDLANIKAFIARGDQAVTYGPGTWHAPMVVLGEREVEFVVAQYMNGVADDDVQEVEMVVRDERDGIEVDVSAGEVEVKEASSKL